ncbi:hypothetical protein HpHUE59_15400 [Helicobacter pylori]
MWNEKNIKIIPVMLFLFCLLEIFELGLIIVDMNKAEKLEAGIKANLKMLENITKHSECMDLEHSKDKEIQIK